MLEASKLAVSQSCPTTLDAKKWNHQSENDDGEEQEPDRLTAGDSGDETDYAESNDRHDRNGPKGSGQTVLLALQISLVDQRRT